MTRTRCLSVFALVALLLMTFVPVSHAQAPLRTDHTWFIAPHLGMSNYLGDNEESPINLNGDMFSEGLPWSVGLNVGYQYTDKWSVALGGRFANYPVITQFTEATSTDAHETQRTNVMIFARRNSGYMTSRISPYLQAGLHATWGETWIASNPNTAEGEVRLGGGPMIGGGFDIVMNERTSLLIDWVSNVTFGDDRADGTQDQGFGAADWLNSFTFGVQYALNPRRIPVAINSLDCPVQLNVGEAGTFNATVNEDATLPVTYSWNMGDGSAAHTGLGTMHTFDSAGTYTVGFTAGNRVGSVTETCAVNVVVPCTPATITDMRASSISIDAGQSIDFSAAINSAASTPVTYRWTMGDGSAVHTGANTTHTFTAPGTYTVTLEVTNCGGTVRRTMVITVNRVLTICDTITEMNSVFFGRNSSTLTPEARVQLQENLDVLAQCPNLRARVEGFASEDERRCSVLAQDRARAVSQFYMDNGIGQARIDVMGMGCVGGTSKKEGLSQFRRADTIPLRN